jgi:hypothetical protein
VARNIGKGQKLLRFGARRCAMELKAMVRTIGKSPKRVRGGALWPPGDRSQASGI